MTRRARRNEAKRTSTADGKSKGSQTPELARDAAVTSRPPTPEPARIQGLTYNDPIPIEDSPPRVPTGRHALQGIRIPVIYKNLTSPNRNFANQEVPLTSRTYDYSEYRRQGEYAIRGSPRSAEFGSSDDERSVRSIGSLHSGPPDSVHSEGENDVISSIHGGERQDQGSPPAAVSPVAGPSQPLPVFEWPPPDTVRVRFKRCKVCKKTVLGPNLEQHCAVHRAQGVRLEEGSEAVDDWYDVYELD
ncbi:hypothetical protein OBBRIDRAFT_830529 [Obba rivulosa]|uniref:Uncharacterized protein n=1 Tax=Obba rivulosa TaxID=1052685 RepID=A0A8E2J6T4_9APHY|nr:hypothetical protein OBBRIDRAFT_830529 [Obba rivulosa]